MPRSGWLAVGAGIGALVVAQDDRRLLAVLLLAIGCLSATAPWLSARHRGLILATSVGTVAIISRSLVAPGGADLAGVPEGSGPWRMLVETVGSPRDGQQVATIRTFPNASAGFRLAATLPRYPAVEPGDRIEVGGRVRARPDSPYGRYLDRLGAWGTLDARSLVVLDRPTDAGAQLEHVRRQSGDLLTAVLPEPEAGLAAGILIGLRDRVDRDVAGAFTTAGVSHVVAISGWNIAIVAAAIASVAGGLSRRRRAIVTAIAITAYIAVAGASPSVLRAGAMAGVVLIARESGRTGRAAAALGWAVVLLLLADPALIVDAGFQLSTLATAGLITWASPLTERIDRWTGGRLPRWLSESLGVSLAAQAATLPVVLASFGRLALIAPVVNLLVVPLVAPAMAAGLVAMIGGVLVGVGAPSAVGAILGAPGWVALRSMIGIVEIGAAVPLASIGFEPAIGVMLGLACVGVVAMIHVRRSRRVPARDPRDRAGGGAGLVSAATIAPRPTPMTGSPLVRLVTYALIVAVGVAGAVAVTRPRGVARLTILDVGQGDAILVEGSRGGRLLVDGGPDPDRLLVELDRRIPPWDRRIDAIVLSHPHEDHVAGLALLLQRYRVGRVLEPGMRGPGPGYGAWLDRLGRDGAPVRSGVAAGDRLVVDEISMLVLWPVRGQVPADPPDTGTGINNVSVVILGTVGDRRFLLAGDVEEDIDPRLLAGGLPTVDVLKVAHHGSRTATTEAFVARVQPRVAVASAGTGNPYGHPARATMERLASTGARVFRTDRDGSVTVSFDGAGLTVATQPRRTAGSARSPRTASDAGRATAAAGAMVASSLPNGPRRSFLCGVPLTPAQARAAAAPLPPPARPAILGRTPAIGPPTGLGYHRGDDRPRPDRRRSPALLPGSPTVVRRARARRGGGGRLPGAADRGQWDRGRPGGRGGRRAAARHRQDPAGRRSGPDPPPWLRFRGVADGTRPPGAGPPRCGASGHAPRRR